MEIMLSSAVKPECRMRDVENTWPTLEGSDDDVLTQLHGVSVTDRIATGPQQGRKVFTLQSLPAREEQAGINSSTANHNGSPHVIVEQQDFIAKRAG